MKFVIVFPYKFTENYHHRYEIEFLQGFGEVVVWELGGFLHPRFTKAITASSAQQNYVRKVTSWAGLARELKALGSRGGKGGEVVFLQFSPSASFRALVCNILIKFRAGAIVDFSNSGVPTVSDVGANAPVRNLASRVVAKAVKLVRILRNGEFSKGYQAAWSAWVQSVSRLFPLQPTHRLVAGRSMAERYRMGSPSGRVKVVAGSTWDFSNAIAYKNATEQPLVDGRYAVLLDGAGPEFVSDVEFLRDRPVLTSEKWYPALTSWFDQLERETGVKIVVAGHPKSTFPENPPQFGFRRVYYGCTGKLVHHAEFVITRFSTALSYAIIHRKPILCIYNDQIKSDSAVFERFCDRTAILGVRPINLDAPPSCTEEYLKIPEEAYGRYEANYLTSLSDPKPNYRVITEEILGLKSHIEAGNVTADFR